MLESFTVDTFSPLEGDAFVMHLDPTNEIHLQLVEAVSMGGPDPTDARPAGRRRPFTLVFRGPRSPVAIQRIYRLDHATLGSFELFLVPLGPDARGMLYEAVFT